MIKAKSQTSATTKHPPVKDGQFFESPPQSLRTQTFQAEPLDSESHSWFRNSRTVWEPLKKRFQNEFLRLLRESDFEYGYSSPAEEYVSTELRKHPRWTREWINELFLNFLEDSYILGGILRVISHFEYKSLYPQGITMCTAALKHAETTVKEEAVRVIENWENTDMIPLLKCLNVREKWLSEYIDQVIWDLEANR